MMLQFIVKILPQIVTYLTVLMFAANRLLLLSTNDTSQFGWNISLTF